MNRDRLPLQQPVDYVLPDERVPREISAAPPLWVELLIVLGTVVVLLWLLPDILAITAQWSASL